MIGTGAEIRTTESAAADVARPRAKAALAWFLAIASLAAMAAGFLLWTATGFAPPPNDQVRGPWVPLAAFATTLSFALVGLLLTLRRPDNPVGWILALIALVEAARDFAVGYVTYARLADPPLPAAQVVAWLPAWIELPAATLLLVLLLLVFPDGRLLSRRWARAAWLGAAGATLLAIGSAFTPGRLEIFTAVENPFGVGGAPGSFLPIGSATGFILLTASFLAAAGAMVLRYRRAHGVERQQLKWFAFTAVLGALLFGPFFAFFVLARESPVAEAAAAATLLEFALVPVTVAIAILRHRLYDIDLILSRTFVYGSLMAILAGLYTASIRLFQSLFVAVTGNESDAAIVITTLILATSFTPLKRRLEGVVEARYRDEPRGETAATAEEGRGGQLSPGELEALIERVSRRVVREELDGSSHGATGRESSAEQEAAARDAG